MKSYSCPRCGREVNALPVGEVQRACPCKDPDFRPPIPSEGPDEPAKVMRLDWYGGFAIRRTRFTTDPLPDGIPVTVEIDGEMYTGVDTGTEFVVRGVCLVGTVAE